jgi:hypothetical protein
MGQFGGTAAIKVTGDLFKDLMRQIGVLLRLYKRGQLVNCTCFSKTYNVADRNCTICNGTGNVGGWTKEPHGVLMGILQIHPRFGRGNSNQRLHTKHGPVDTMDAVMYCEGKWFKKINLGDSLVWFPKGEPEGYEYKIVAKDPQIGMKNIIIYNRFELRRNPYPLRVNATNLSDTV